MSSSDDENFIRYGTPLDPYEEDEIPSKRKFQQPPDQYAVDANGRRRFHGAFTGGFSAGFGNTVGTPEGWMPATFKSSRNEKAQVSSQRPEDFMDEEDRGEFGIAPLLMQTHSEFTGQKRARPSQFHDGPIPGQPVLEQLVCAVHETAAVKMLRAMGWKEGQGTGDRLSTKQKRHARLQHKDTQTEEEDHSSGSEFDYETLYAPDDYEPYILHRKNDRFGLGYSGLSRHSVLGNLTGEYGSEAGTSRSHLVMKEKGKKVSIRGHAFGVGAFEADDEDIYAKEDMSHYDFAIGGTDQKLNKQITKKTSNNVLEGFVKSSKPLPAVASYPPPALPRDYTPAVLRRSRFEPTAVPQRDQGLGRHELSAEARGAILGETSPIKTVGQPTITVEPPLMTTTEDLVAKLSGRNVNLLSKNENPELDFIPITDSGNELTKVFRPFVSDPQKQKRYEKYLKKDSSVWDGDGNSDRLSEWERNRETVEFEQAAKLYKPLTGIMGDRFTHASEPDAGALNPLCAVAKSAVNHGSATPEQIAAAQRGLYGVITRGEAQWRPEPLVCKRFNVPDPGGARPEQKKEDQPKVSYSIFSYLESSVHDKDTFAKEQSTFSGSKSLQNKTINQSDNKNCQNSLPRSNVENASNQPDRRVSKVSNEVPSTGFNKRMTVAELFLKESEKSKTQGVEVTQTIDKFDKMDLYKSIFLSDSEDDEVRDDKNKNDNNHFVEVPKNLERNTSPPRGIFANIDFDELNSWKRNIDDNKPVDTHTETEKDKNPVQNSIVENNDMFYGPKIPDNLRKRLESDNQNSSRDHDIQEIGSSSSSDSWVDVKQVKAKQKKKKNKKHKSKHKKSKHSSKHKKKDR